MSKTIKTIVSVVVAMAMILSCMGVMTAAASAKTTTSKYYPIATKNYKIVAKYKSRMEGNYLHDGIDIAAKKGTAVYAAGAGKVVLRGHYNGYGKTVIIKCSGNKLMQYSHLDNLLVKKNAKVAKGQMIGRVGSSGAANGVKLHFAVLNAKTKKSVDPKGYCKLMAKK